MRLCSDSEVRSPASGAQKGMFLFGHGVSRTVCQEGLEPDQGLLQCLQTKLRLAGMFPKDKWM